MSRVIQSFRCDSSRRQRHTQAAAEAGVLPSSSEERITAAGKIELQPKAAASGAQPAVTGAAKYFSWNVGGQHHNISRVWCWRCWGQDNNGSRWWSTKASEAVRGVEYCCAVVVRMFCCAIVSQWFVIQNHAKQIAEAILL